MRRLCAILLAASALAACAVSPSPTPTTPSPSSTIAAPPTQPAIGQRREPSLPEPRQEVASAATDQVGLWVLGGFDARGTSTSSVFRFDGAGWSRETPLPLGLDHAAAAADDGSIYLAGGYSGGRASRRVFTLPGAHELASLNHARGALALVAAGGKLYAIGGSDGSREVGPAEEYDPAAGRWIDLPALPRPRNHVAGFVYRGLACVGGGRSPNTAAVDCWDPGGRRWTSLSDLPKPTSGAGAGTLGERVVVAGGEDPSSGAIVDQVAVLAGNTWLEESMLVPRHGIALAAYRGRLWACGGGASAGLDAVADCTSLS